MHTEYADAAMKNMFHAHAYRRGGETVVVVLRMIDLKNEG